MQRDSNLAKMYLRWQHYRDYLELNNERVHS